MKALKEFKYTHDGYTLLTLKPGDDASDVPADAVAGLTAEGYIGSDDAEIETKVVEAAPEVGEAEPLEEAAGEAEGAGEAAESDLTPAQEAALDRDGDGKAGGSKKKGA